MAEWISVAGDVVSCAGLMLMFLLLTEPRYSARVTAAGLSTVFVLTAAVYILLVMGLGFTPGQASLVSFSIPSLAACFVVSKYRDSRFLFTFCTVDVFGFMLIALSRAISISVGGGTGVTLGVSLLLTAALAILFWRIGPAYRRMMAGMPAGWGMLALVSVLFYAMLYLLITYPRPLVERVEYTPVVGFFSLTVLAVYVVIYQTIERSVRLAESEQSELLLQTRLELQKSQLELQQVYYQMAYVDSLTGLSNRAAFENRRREIEAEIDGARPVWCVSADLNNLKTVNDARGHEAGDRLLRETAALMREALGDAFQIFRMGGDEFLMLASGDSAKEAPALLERFYPAVRAHNAQSDLPVDVAAGWDCLREGERDLTALIARTDREMYRRKREMKEAPVDEM